MTIISCFRCDLDFPFLHFLLLQEQEKEVQERKSLSRAGRQSLKFLWSCNEMGPNTNCVQQELMSKI